MPDLTLYYDDIDTLIGVIMESRSRYSNTTYADLLDKLHAKLDDRLAQNLHPREEQNP
jgi:hypothetical protein